MNLTDAIPFRLFTVGDHFLIEWILPETQNDQPQLPFIQSLKEKNQVSHIGGRSFIPLSSLGEVISTLGSLKPSLFIYHATRCGSTLMGRMLKSGTENRVFNEPSAVTELFMNFRSIDDTIIKKTHLSNMIGAFGLGAPTCQKNLVFKFASLCNIFFDEIRAVFPDTPSVFMYRDPVEIMVSLVTEPSMWLDNVHSEKFVTFLPWSKKEAATLDIEHLACLYLEQQFQWAIGQAEVFSRLVNYTELPEAGFEIAEKFLHAGIREKCSDVLLWNAKKPDKPFVPDSQKKQGMASPQILELAETRLYPLYRGLEAKRMEKLSSFKSLKGQS
ncbi:MAG: hypothetical protein HQM08_13875 [Candidatus Riflebacteria bacterium]|nr:hypothetical protein [Candidatus Riflebacteria bacterium]